MSTPSTYSLSGTCSNCGSVVEGTFPWGQAANTNSADAPCTACGCPTVSWSGPVTHS